MTQLAFSTIALAQAPNSNALALFLDGADGIMKVKDVRGQVAPLSDFVTGGGGGGGLSGNLIDVSSNVVNFVGGQNAIEVIITNTPDYPFIFTANDDVNALTFYGDSSVDNVRIGFEANRNGNGGSVYFNFADSQNLFFSNSSYPNGFFQFDNINYWSNLTYRLLIGSDNELTPSGMLDVVNSNSSVSNLRLVGNPLIGGAINTKLDFVPNNSGDNYINYASGLMYLSFNGTNVANFTGSTTANFILYNNMTIGNTTSPVSSSLEVFQTGNSKANVRLSGITTGDNSYLRFAPFSGSSSFIDYVSGQLHFSFNGTEVARFGANTTANFIVYNNMTIGNNTAPTNSSLDVHQTGNTNVNLRLTGKLTGDNSYLTFSPFSGSQSFLDTSAQLNFQFGTSTIANYTSSVWTFSGVRLSVTPALTTNLSALILTPTYSSTGNNALSITGSSSQATTRGISITSSYTGATSNAFFIGSSVTASGGLAVSGLITPTLVASANADVLVAKDINPTFTNGAFTGVFNHSLRVQTGSVAFATTSGFVTIGDTFNRSSTTAKFSISQTGSTLGFTYAQQIDVLATQYGLYINNGLGAGLSNLPKYGMYSNSIHGNAQATMLNYGIYGRAQNGYKVYAGYFEANQNNAGVGVESTALYATNTNFNSAASSNAKIYGGYFSVANNIVSGGTGMTYGVAINQVAQTGTAQWKYFECQLTGATDFYIGSQTTFSNGRQIWSSIGMLITSTASTDINANALLQVDSTTKGVLFPRMTTAQKNAITSPNGLVVFDTDLGKLCVRSTTWQTITSA